MGTGISLILDWENGIYSLGLDLATGNGMNNYKIGMGFLFFSGLCSNILKKKKKISLQKTLHSTVGTVKSVFFAFAPAI